MSPSAIIKTIGIFGGAILLFILFQQLKGHLEEYDRRGQAEVTAERKAAELQANLDQVKQQQQLIDEIRAMGRTIGDRVEAARTERTVVYQTVRKEIEDAPPEDDGPVAPVLQRAVERLSGPRATTGPGDTDPNQVGSTGDRPTP